MTNSATAADNRPKGDQTADKQVVLVALVLLALLTIFRLVYAAGLGMAEDETYYWQWSRHLAAAYYDQGPGIAYMSFD